jgi:hypothetical protein
LSLVPKFTIEPGEKGFRDFVLWTIGFQAFQPRPKVFEPTPFKATLFQKEQKALLGRRPRRLVPVRGHTAAKRLIDACRSLGKPAQEQQELCLMGGGAPGLRTQLQFLSECDVALQVPLGVLDFAACQV